MSDGSNRSQNSLINILLVPLILALVAGTTSPWWFEPLQDAFRSGEKKADVTEQPSSTEEPKPSTTPEDASEPSGESTIPEKKTSIEKLDVSLVEVNNDNEYSSNYGTSKIIDSNVKSYWSTKSGSILDVVLDFYFDEPKSISQVNIYSPKDGGSHTQPVEVDLIFLGNSGEEITSQTITLKSSSDQWQEYKLERVDNVSSVKVDLGEPKNNTASYITINEIRFYGYE